MSCYPLNPPPTTQDGLAIYLFKLDTFFSKIRFFPSGVIKWNKLDLSIRNSETLSIFKKCILQFIRSSPGSTFNCFNTKGIKHLRRLRFSLNHLGDHKFKYDVLDSLSPICSCGLDIETTCHYLLYCPYFINERTLLLIDVPRITKDALPSCETTFVKLLLYGKDSFDPATSTLILNASVNHILSN